MAQRLARAVALAAAVVVTMSLGVISPESSTAAKSVPRSAAVPPSGHLSVFQYNVCGYVVKAWCTAHGGTDNNLTRSIVSHVAKEKPSFVSFQEICKEQYEHLRQRFAAAGHAMEGGFSDDGGRDARCSGPEANQVRGQAVLSRDPVYAVRTYPIDHRPDGAVRLTCLQVRPYGRPSAMCTTHLTAEDPEARQQAQRLRRVLDDNYNDNEVPVIVAGDFNLPPTDAGLNPIYAHNGGNGRFSEADELTGLCPGPGPHRCGWPTDTLGWDKIDYIFASRKHFADPQAYIPRNLRWSDHWPLHGQFRALFA